jgi:hypothetical protein
MKTWEKPHYQWFQVNRTILATFGTSGACTDQSSKEDPTERQERSPVPQTDFPVAMLSTLVGILTGPFTGSCLSVAHFKMIITFYLVSVGRTNILV